MRKRNMSYLIDKLLWLFVLLLPVFAYFLMPLGYQLTDSSAALPTFADYISQFGISSDNVVYTAIVGMFGSTNGIIHMFDEDSSLLLFFTYFVTVELVHLVVDFIVFIPRLAHKWMSVFTREGDD